MRVFLAKLYKPFLALATIIARWSRWVFSFATSDRISALSNLGLLLLAVYGLFLTSIPETLVGALSEEVSALKNEKIALSEQLEELHQQKTSIEKNNALVLDEYENLKKIRAEHILNVKESIIDGIISNIEKQYADGTEKARQLSHLKELKDWVADENANEEEINQIHSDVTWFRSNWRTSENLSRINKIIEERKYTRPKDYEDEILNNSLIRWCRDCDEEKALSPQELYDKKVEFFKNKEKVIAVINVLEESNEVEQVKLLPIDDKKKLEEFIDAYAADKIEIYKYKVYPLIDENWTFETAKKEGERVEAYIQKMSDDVAAFRLALEKFFTGLAQQE